MMITVLKTQTSFDYYYFFGGRLKLKCNFQLLVLFCFPPLIFERFVGIFLFMNDGGLRGSYYSLSLVIKKYNIC